MRKYALLIEYDGTHFSGWQKQKEERTVQGEVERVLSEVLGESISVHGASRTDAGVHSVFQVASFVSKRDDACDFLLRAVNALLPSDVRVRDVCEVPEGFNPQKDAVSKTYLYALYEGLRPSPFFHRFVVPVGISIDHHLWQDVCRCWIGEHDFRPFMNAGTPVRSTVRRVDKITVKRIGSFVFFIITANAFLKQMVRNMVGALLEMQKGKLDPDELREMKPRDTQRGFRYTAPPQGLFLLYINFKYNLPFGQKTGMIYEKLKEWGHEV